MNRKGDKSLIVGLDIGTSKVVALVGEYSAHDPLEIIGILPNKFRRNVALQVGIRESLAADPSVASLLIPHSLGLRAAFAEADHPEAEPHSVFELGGSNEAKEEATAMAAFVARKVGL